MKGLVSLFLLLFIFSAYSQDYSFEQLYKGINEDNVIAASSKVKTEVVYGHKSESSTKGEFLYKKNFSKDGRLVASRWLDKSINKFVDSEFSYDSQNRLVKMTNNINSLVYNLDLTIVNYSDNNKIASMYHFYGPKESVKMDTLHYYYDKSGKLSHKVFLRNIKDGWGTITYIRDTIRYTYKGEELWYSSRKRLDFLARPPIVPTGGLVLWIPLNNTPRVVYDCVLNTSGCVTKVEHPYVKADMLEIQRDSLCNMLVCDYKTLFNNQWYVVEETKRTFNGKLVTEEKGLVRKGQGKFVNSGKLVFDNHLTYKYFPEGLLEQKSWYKESGKLKKVQKYTYEFY